MRYKSKTKRCRTCRYQQRMGADKCCDHIGMTGRSRVKEGTLSDGPYRPCAAWEARNAAEQKRLIEERRRGKFNESLTDDVVIMRTTGEKRSLRARDELRGEDRGDMARALGMSSRAAEALYGGGQL